MKKVLTAIGNSTLNKKIKELEKYEILSEDISVDNELIEILQREEEVDILFLHKNIVKNYILEEFIDLIKQINENIFIILFKEDDLNNDLEDDDKIKIYNGNEIKIEEFDSILNKENENIKKLNSTIISISGPNGVGKSTFSTFFAKNVENKKILLIDFDLDENNVRTILKLKKSNKDENTINSLIINVNSNLDILCDLKKIYPNKESINFFTVQKMLKALRQNYDIIIIDTSSNFENDYIKRIFYNSDKIICLLEPNILGIKKLKSIFEIFENDWNLSEEKINIVINKANMYEVNESVIKELFPNYNILGKIKYNDIYNLIINKDINNKDIKKEYIKIVEKVV